MKKNWEKIAFIALLVAIIVCHWHISRQSDAREAELNSRVTSLIHRLCTHVATDAVGTPFRKGDLTNDLTWYGSGTDMRIGRFDTHYYFDFYNKDLSEEEMDKIANDKAYYDNFVQELRNKYKNEFKITFGRDVPDITISATRVRRADMATPVDFPTPVKAKDVAIKVKVEYRGMPCTPEE